jgi:hypothetical protein
MRRFSHLDNLRTYRTPKERLSNFLWDALFLGVVCVIAWDIGVYALRFGESGRASQFVVVAVLTLANGWLMWLAFQARPGGYWYRVIVPILVAFAGPFVLQALER